MMSAMLPPHYDGSTPGGGLGSLYDPHNNPNNPLSHHPQPSKPKLLFKMPRVVPDQKTKFESDELFRRLARESEVCMCVCLCMCVCTHATQTFPSTSYLWFWKGNLTLSCQ